MASNAPRVNLQDMNVKIPLNTNIPIVLSPGSPVLPKSPSAEESQSNEFAIKETTEESQSNEFATEETTEENQSSELAYIQLQIDILRKKLKEGFERNDASNDKFQKHIENVITKAKICDRGEVEILYNRITILETENVCLKNEIKSQKEIIKFFQSNENNEHWVIQNKSKSKSAMNYERNTPTPVNLQNRFQILEDPEQYEDKTPQNSD